MLKMAVTSGAMLASGTCDARNVSSSSSTAARVPPRRRVVASAWRKASRTKSRSPERSMKASISVAGAT